MNICKNCHKCAKNQNVLNWNNRLKSCFADFHFLNERITASHGSLSSFWLSLHSSHNVSILVLCLIEHVPLSEPICDCPLVIAKILKLKWTLELGQNSAKEYDDLSLKNCICVNLAKWRYWRKCWMLCLRDMAVRN